MIGPGRELAIPESPERPTLERLAALSMARREQYNLAVYGHGLDHDPELGTWLDLSAPHSDAELVGFIMKNRLIDSYDVVMALHAPDLPWACEVLWASCTARPPRPSFACT